MPQDGCVISVDLARELRDAGLRWTPQSGDRFVVDERDMDDEVFVLSSMTIEVYEYASGPVIRFNGTTEWALDSLDQNDALWLPSEAQLRTALGGTFRRLELLDGTHRVETVVPGRRSDPQMFAHADPAEAYGLALLDLLRQIS